MGAIAKNVSLLERHARLLNWFRSPAGGYTSDAEVFRDALDALAEKRRTEAARDFYRIFGEAAGPGLSDKEEAALAARCRPKGRAA